MTRFIPFRVLATSPTIDAGSLGDAYVREPTPNGDRVNLGHTGNTALATTSASQFKAKLGKFMRAARAGKDVLLANKEALVIGGAAFNMKFNRSLFQAPDGVGRLRDLILTFLRRAIEFAAPETNPKG